MAERMPALFIGHGSPMNTLETNRWTAAWGAYGTTLPRPRAVLSISAHWYINATAVTAMAQPRTIHDFFGFPPELFAYQYAAPGDPGLADEVVELLRPTWVGLDVDSWGIDHGTWLVLAHLLPGADVPVVQLSIDAQKPLEEHLHIGARLAPLRDEGVLIVASGNIVHNLGILEWQRPDEGADWAVDFDAEAQDLLVADPAGIGRLVHHEAWHLAVPTMDHFLPFAYFAGLASVAEEPATTIVEGCTLGSLSMTSYALTD